MPQTIQAPASLSTNLLPVARRERHGKVGNRLTHRTPLLHAWHEVSPRTKVLLLPLHVEVSAGLGDSLRQHSDTRRCAIITKATLAYRCPQPSSRLESLVYNGGDGRRHVSCMTCSVEDILKEVGSIGQRDVENRGREATARSFRAIETFTRWRWREENTLVHTRVAQ